MNRRHFFATVCGGFVAAVIPRPWWEPELTQLTQAIRVAVPLSDYFQPSTGLQESVNDGTYRAAYLGLARNMQLREERLLAK